MFISEAYAQTAGGGGGEAFQAFLPLILIFVVFYFLLIRPQQKKMKEHKAMLGAIRRGDKVITGGGILATVSKVDNENEVTVEIAKDVKVKVQRQTIQAVVNRTEPVSGNAANDSQKKSGGLFGGLLGGGAQKPANEEPPASDAAKDNKDADASSDADVANEADGEKKDADKS